MYGAFTNNFSLPLILVAIGIFFIEFFAAVINDFYDYERDLKNNRIDKWIVAGLLSRKQMLYISLSTLIASVLVLSFTSILVLFVGVYYLFLAFLYTFPAKFKLKNFHIKGYLLASTPWIVMPFTLSLLLLKPISILEFIFAAFFYSQYLYLLSQKDSTDLKDNLKDDTNIFISGKWSSAFLITLSFGIISLLALLSLSMTFLPLLVIWIFNGLIKFYILNSIRNKQITRQFRVKVTLFEFLTPHFYSIGLMW